MAESSKRARPRHVLVLDQGVPIGQSGRACRGCRQAPGTMATGSEAMENMKRKTQCHCQVYVDLVFVVCRSRSRQAVQDTGSPHSSGFVSVALEIANAIGCLML